jgi:hypothetical protein
LALESGDDDAMKQLHGRSIIYRIAVGSRQGRKVFALKTAPPCEHSPGGPPLRLTSRGVEEVPGHSF